MDRHLKKMEDGAPHVLGAQPYPSHHFGRLGAGHVGRFLLYASFNNNKGEQLRSCRGLTDYLSYLSCQLDDATPALVCAELLERACCPMLQLLGTGMRQPLWLPSSLVELHLRDAPPAAPFASGEAAKEASAQAVRQLLKALEAVSALGLFEKLRIAPSGVVAASHATLGLVAMERAAVLLLARTPP